MPPSPKPSAKLTTTALRAELKKTKKVDDAVLKVVRPVFKATKNIRFEGNNYSEAWVKEAAKRGLPNLRRTPESLAQLTSKKSREPARWPGGSLISGRAGVALSKAVRMERQGEGHAHRAPHPARDGR